MSLRLLYLPLLFFFLFSCSKKDEIKPIPTETKQEKTMELKITSTAFEEGGMIPKKYTCDAENVSPPLAWSNAPSGTKSYALICDDPDAPAGTWVHWVVYNIPESEKGLSESVPPNKKLDNGTMQGISDFGNPGYGGPCPPGGTHRYFFKLYALDTTLSFQSDVTKDSLLGTMKGHVIAEGQLMGKYTRSR
jgi:Raf kinase inhibitor-like YbhB/YbcL family protein